jgi:hypothetical protein
MARGRAKLTDKQERILVQAQLMGLTPRDMTQISNRLVALQREADEIKNVGEAIQGYSWKKDEKNRWVIATPEGYHCAFTKEKTGRTHYWDKTWDYTVKITKPGTAFQTRIHRKKSVSFRDEWVARLCPENSKELYGLIKFCGHHIHQLIK